MSERNFLVEGKGASTIPKGTVLCDSRKQHWIVGDALDIDGSRDMYAVALDDGKLPNYTAAAIFKKLDYDPQSFVDLSDNNFIMISDICNPAAIEAWKREKNLRHLGVPSIIGSGNYKFNDKFYSYMITQRYGDNLQQLLKNNKKGFVLPTIYEVVGQMTQVLEYIHSLGYYNIFCISSDKLLQSFTDPNNIYLDVIDYGKTPESFSFKSRYSQVGNACGDLESLMYMVFNWMKLRVPWNKLMDDDVAINTQKEKAFNDIEKFLTTVFGKYRVLAPIQKFMKILASTANANEPDYDRIRLCISEGIRNIRNVNHNLDGGIDFKAELQLRKRKAKYVRPVFKKASTTISSQKLVIQTIHKSSEKKWKGNNVSKKKIQRSNNQVKVCSVTLNRCGLQYCANTQLDNLQKASVAEANSMNNTAEQIMHTVLVADTISNAAPITFATKSNDNDDVSETTMSCQDQNPLMSSGRNTKVARNVTITSAVTKTPIKKLQCSARTELESTIISSDTKRGAKRNDQQAVKPTVSRRFKKMKVISIETNTRETEEELTETESFEKKKQQQHTTSSAVSKIMNDTSSSEPDMNITRMDSEILGECSTKVDDSLQRTKVAIRAIRPLNAESEVVSLQIKDLEKKLELLESALSSYDDLQEAFTKEPKTLDNIQTVKKKWSFYQKTFYHLRCQLMTMVPKAHKHKIAITEFWNKTCCVGYRIKEIEDILNKCVHALSVASSQTKKQETSTGSTNLQILVREDEKSRRREEEQPKNKSNEKSNYVRVTMKRNSVETVTEKPERRKGQNEMNEKSAKLHDGLNRVESSTTRLKKGSHEIKKSLTKNANEEDLERVLRAFKTEGITITRVQKKK